jgi:histidyl-tRNA synthetase
MSGVEQLLKKGRKDQSGDFTKGADLSDAQTTEVVNFLKLKNISDIKNILTDKLAIEGINEIQKILEGIKYSGYESQINFNPTVVRGLEYYTGAIFEANLTFKVKNLKGKEVEFGSIGGGGRYDNLVSRFNKIDLPATGISIGLDRLIFALIQLEKINYSNKEPVIICILDEKYLPKYYEILKELRDTDINSEIYLGDSSLKSQLKYADKRNSPAVILCGDNEFKENKITIKNLKKGKIESEKLQSREDWKQSENIQATFPKENLINEIKKLI